MLLISVWQWDILVINCIRVGFRLLMELQPKQSTVVIIPCHALESKFSISGGKSTLGHSPGLSLDLHY